MKPSTTIAVLAAALALGACGRTSLHRGVRVGASCPVPFGEWLVVREHRDWPWSGPPQTVEAELPGSGAVQIQRSCIAEAPPAGVRTFVVAGGAPLRDAPDAAAPQIGHLRGAQSVVFAAAEGEFRLALEEGMPRGFVHLQAAASDAPSPEESLKAALAAADSTELAVEIVQEVDPKMRARPSLRRRACRVAIAVGRDVPGGPGLAECEAPAAGLHGGPDDTCVLVFGKPCSRVRDGPCDAACAAAAHRDAARKARQRCRTGREWAEAAGLHPFDGLLLGDDGENTAWLCPATAPGGAQPDRFSAELFVADWRGGVASAGTVRLARPDSACAGTSRVRSVRPIGNGACVDIEWNDSGCPRPHGERMRRVVCAAPAAGTGGPAADLVIGGVRVTRTPVAPQRCSAATRTETEEGPETEVVEYRPPEPGESAECYEVHTRTRADGTVREAPAEGETILCVRGAWADGGRTDAAVALRPGRAGPLAAWPAACGERAAAAPVQPGGPAGAAQR